MNTEELARRLAEILRAESFAERLPCDSADEGSLYCSLNRLLALAEAQTQQKQALLAAETLHHAVLEHIVDGIITIDQKAVVQSFNRAAEQIFGYAASEVIGQNIKMLMPEPYASQHDGYMERYHNTREAHIIGIGREVRGRRKDGSTFPLDLGVSEMVIGGQKMYSGIVRDITERKQAEQALLVAETRQRVVLENIVDGIITIDYRGIIESFNRAAEKIFGYAAGEVMGQNIKMLMPEPYASQHDGYLARYGVTGEAHIIGIGREVEGRRKDGSIFPLELAVSELEIQGRKMFSGIVRDITERKATERALVEARDTAESSTRAKSEFLANMSHEIRTPMNAVINLAYLAQQGELPHRGREYLRKIEDSGKNLLAIINDILDFSKVEAGKLQLEEISFDLHRLFQQLATTVNYRAVENNVEVMFQTDREIPRHVVGDPLRLGQVLTNLIGNALKFTENGEVVLSIRIVERSEEQIRLQFSVRDTGIGMSAEQVSRLFSSFGQADGSITRKYGGTGLGLAISQHLVQLMGGSILVESELHQGRNFSFTIPLQTSHEATPECRLPASAREQVRILVVDDNETARHIATETLRSFGFTTNEAASGEGALEALSNASQLQASYDIVLLDWKMPHLDGLETLEKIRRHSAIKQPKVIFCTAYGVEPARDHSTHLAVEVYLSKPFNNSTLLDAIHQCLGHAPIPLEEVPRTDEKLAQELSKLANVRILLVDDNEINQMIGADLLQCQNIPVTAVGSGQAALDAVKTQRFDLVLMDVQMPEMDGLEATRRLREDPTNKHLPVVAMTAHAMESDREKSLAAGMNDHLTKPIDPEELYRALVHWVGKSRGPELASRGPKTPNGGGGLPDHLPGIDQSIGLRQLRGNRAFYHKLLVKMHNQYRQSGRELDDLLARGAQEEAIRLVHSIKGVAGSLGATALFESSNELEQALRAESGAPPDTRTFKAALDVVIGGLASV